MSNTPNPYFLYPFGENGDATAISNTGTDAGTVNYEYGWTTSYQLDLETNPDALPIPRQQMNQLFFDITSALQQLQQYGVPAWVSVGSGGPATGYPLYARVLYSGLIYESETARNQSPPGVD